MKLYEDFKEWAIKELNKTKKNPVDTKETLILLIKEAKNFERLEMLIGGNDIEGEPLFTEYWKLFSKFFK